MKPSIKDRVVARCFTVPSIGIPAGREVVFARDAIEIAADERRDGHATGFAEALEMAAAYIDQIDILREHAHMSTIDNMKLVLAMVADGVRSLATAPTGEKK
jgi:hypothetical protein